MTPEQKAVFDGHKWQLEMHLNCSDGGQLIHSCEALCLQRLIFTPKVKGRWGEQKVTYHLKDDEAVYNTLAEVADVILSRRHVESEGAA